MNHNEYVVDGVNIHWAMSDSFSWIYEGAGKARANKNNETREYNLSDLIAHRSFDSFDEINQFIADDMNHQLLFVPNGEWKKCL